MPSPLSTTSRGVPSPSRPATRSSTKVSAEANSRAREAPAGEKPVYTPNSSSRCRCESRKSSPATLPSPAWKSLISSTALARPSCLPKSLVTGSPAGRCCGCHCSFSHRSGSK